MVPFNFSSGRLPGWNPSFGTSYLNTVSDIYISARKYAENNFESVFALILTLENEGYPLHWASSLSLSSNFCIQLEVNFFLVFFLFFTKILKNFRNISSKFTEIARFLFPTFVLKFYYRSIKSSDRSPGQCHAFFYKIRSVMPCLCWKRYLMLNAVKRADMSLLTIMTIIHLSIDGCCKNRKI